MGFYSGFDSGFGMHSFMSAVFPFIFFTIFGIIIITFIVIGIKGVSTWHTNNNSPFLTVPAKVVTKRNHTSHHSHNDHTSSSTSYYVTFEFESGDRLELYVSSSEYGYLVEGDVGKLSFQGTRYKGFERTRDR